MFNNVGDTIKVVAKVFFWALEIIFFFCWMFSLATTMVYGANDVALAFVWHLLALLFGAFSIWFTSLLLYGFGEIVENATFSKARLAHIEQVLTADPKADDTKAAPSQPGQ